MNHTNACLAALITVVSMIVFPVTMQMVLFHGLQGNVQGGYQTLP